MIDHATLIIDISLALIEHRRGLNDSQVASVETIHRRAVEFITSLIHNREMPLNTFASYLNHDARTPLTVIIGYSEVMLSDMLGELSPPYRDAIQQICDCGYILDEDITEMHDTVRQLL